MSIPSIPLHSRTPSPDVWRWMGAFIGLVLATYPIVAADRLYLDDIWRSMYGEPGWTSNARPLADIVMLALNQGSRVVELAPLPLWLGLAGVATMLVALRQAFVEFSDGHAWLAMSLLVLQPFFLQNLSYQFDALPMALAVSCAGLALAVGMRASPGKGIVLSAIGLFASLCFYQAAVSVYFVLLAFHALLSLTTNGTLQWRRHVGLLATGAVTLLGYKLISGWWLAGGYSLSHSQMAAPAALPMHIVDNTLTFWRYAARTLAGAPWWGLSATVLIALTGLTLGALRPSQAKRPLAWPWRLLIMLIILLLLPLGALGIMAALEDPLWRPRTFIGFGALCAGSLFCAVATCEYYGWRRLGVSMLVLVLGGATVIAYAYGNAQSSQKSFEESVSRQLVDDLRRLEAEGALVVFGTLPLSTSADNTVHAFPVLKELVGSYLDNDYWWGYQNLYRLGLPQRYEFNGDQALRDAFADHCTTLEPLLKRGWYTLYQWQDAIFVSLDGNCRRDTSDS
ncbi:glucosyltransferase domain-containing protein [Chromohalobacter canadensis]|uniref:glucosyltransferase domain-containing protein n=1 Tax=Chromohalobacter canadensis TaxID=141389 RepID=UPI0021BFDF81|nr:glucosyltransferase domain-containing protein [Chromohalobacter canadensis]MCT8467739.1 glucosyltransferase domain-containing protein [Chromohalobacter canadensis]MCT8470513.1 glucosyltransferase domain-containing protein [Chromohalobacter canadensis]MCT8498236.1 glucosyltransferase domain-containing protein [Chromohalobacter canadensis]